MNDVDNNTANDLDRRSFIGAAVAGAIALRHGHWTETRTPSHGEAAQVPAFALEERVDRKFAHSLRFVLPRITAPAARSRAATHESRAAMLSASASDPAVVCIRSAVSMLSLISTGMPCSGPRTLPAFRSASS